MFSKGELKWLLSSICGREIILRNPGGPSVTTKVLTSEGETDKTSEQGPVRTHPSIAGSKD